MRALSYTVNDDRAAQRLLELGTDGIITDRVDLFRQPPDAEILTSPYEMAASMMQP